MLLAIAAVCLSISFRPCQPGKCAGNEPLQNASPEGHRATPPAALKALPSDAHDLADIAGLSPVLRQLEAQQKLVANQSGQPTPALIAARQKLIYLRVKLNTIVQSLNLQIDAMRGRLEAAITQERDLRTSIAEERDRMTHRNSQVNLISGGLTKIVGYSIALAPVTLIPTNVLEIFDGSVQTTLSTLSLRQQQQEKRLEHGMPEVLHAFLTNTQSLKYYPFDVWTFMNHQPPANSSGKSRRELLIALWQANGVLPRSNQTRAQTERKITIRELLDQHLTMLTDLKSVVSEMHSTVMEITDALAESYASDPEP